MIVLSEISTTQWIGAGLLFASLLVTSLILLAQHFGLARTVRKCPHIYIIDPEVTLQSSEPALRIKTDAAEYGIECLFYECKGSSVEIANKPTYEAKLLQARLDLIHKSDVVILKLNHIHDFEPNPVMALEAGYAIALGKPLWIVKGLPIYPASGNQKPQETCGADFYSGQQPKSVIQGAEFSCRHMLLNRAQSISCSYAELFSKLI